jgi:RHS repeat-associated protein
VLFIVLAAALSAQQPDETLPGFKPNNIYDSTGIDNVNLFSGDPGIVIPLGPVYTLGPGYAWQLKAHNTCKFWDFRNTCPGQPGINHARVSGASTLGIGWRLDVGYVTASIASPTAASYASPDGSSRDLNLVSGNGITDDGTHLRGSMHACPAINPSGSTCYTVEFPDGSRQLFDHIYVPGKASGVSSSDFDGGFWDATSSVRAGLTSIVDRFGTTLLKVEYNDNCLATPCASTTAWQIRQIDLYGDSSRAIVFTWGSVTIVGGPTWAVLNQLSFPSTSASVPALTATFSYDAASSFPRNAFDNSVGSGCPTPGNNPSFVYVPFLLSTTLKNAATTLASYGFTYFKSSLSSDPNGSLTDIALPTGGTIHYDYGTTAGSCTASGCPDPETLTGGLFGHVSLPATASPANYNDSIYLDATNAVFKRTTTDAAGHSSVVAFNRTNFFQFLVAPNVDLHAILRRTVVTEQVGLGPPPAFDDTAQRATLYLFHVATPGESASPKYTSGIELERRNFQDTGTGLVRSAVNCWDGNTGGSTTCGAKDASTGKYQTYTLVGDVRQQAQTTWYGANPLGGGTCPSGATPCMSHINTGYDVNARQYQTITVSNANLPNGGGPSHTTYTHWTPWIDTTHWLLGLYDEKNDVEGSTTIYRGYEFDSPNNGVTASAGFLRGVMTSHVPYDSANRKLLLQCSYPDAAGNDSKEFSATYTAADLPPPSGSAGTTSVPYSNLCSAVYSTYPTPTIGTNNDAFGHVYSWSHGLLNTDAWVNGGAGGNPSTLNWFSFNVVRDTSVGLITTSHDTATVATSYAYDALGRITQIAPTGESPTFACYDTTTRTTVYRAPSAVACPTSGASGTIQTWQQYLYDGLGRLIREIRVMPGAGGAGFSYAARKHSYDSAGHRSFDSEWIGCSNPGSDCVSAAPPGTTSASFDPFGRPQTIIRADGSTTTINLTDGPISFSDTKKTVTVNNINGTCNGSCSGGIAATTTYIYDSYERLTSVSEPSGDATAYTYDANGKLTTVSQPSPSQNQFRSFTYDHFGFLRTETTPEKGTVNYNTIGSLANVAQRTENDGTIISTIYDSAGRVSCAGQGVIVMSSGTCANGWSVPTTYVQNFYDSLAGGNSPLGKLTRRVGSNPLTSPFPTTTDDLTYSGVGGRLSQLSTTVTGGSLATVNQTWAYNTLGLVAQLSHARPSGNSLAPLVESTTYVAGLPVAVYANGMPAVTGVDYSPSGAVNHYTTGLISGKTVTTTLAPDPTLMPRPAQISTTGASNNFNTGPYTYDGVGNIALTGADSFSYDNRSRLISANLSGTGSQSYTYDRFGNLLTKGGTTLCITTCSNNRVSGYSYDSRGNQLQSIGESYTYDSLDRTKTSTVGSLTSKYVFDGASERVVKIDSNNNWTYTFRDEASRVSTEFAGSAQSRDNIFLGHQVVGSYANGSVGSNGPVWSFYSSDHLGSPRLVTNVAAGQVEQRRYWPFGEQVVAASPAQRIRFAAMEQDTEAGPGNDRYNDHARHHAAGLGRFLSVDSHDGSPTDPQTWNRYAYALGNPLRYADPDGHSSEDSNSLFAYARQLIRDFLLPTGGRVARADDDRAQALHEAEISASDVERMSNIGARANAELADAAGIVGGVAAEAAAAYVEGKVVGRVFESFSAFKRANGPAGDSLHWHHIVEQTPGNIASFGASRIHSLENVVRLDAKLHLRISAFYSSKTVASGKLTVRQWLSTQSYEAQKKFGEGILQLVLKGQALPRY